ncbi:MAG: putative lipid II flippase FtsW [Actinobacteria bacterium]|nr:putative lipid II flippase FtsW [Actinomycetota bacterium]
MALASDGEEPAGAGFLARIAAIRAFVASRLGLLDRPLTSYYLIFGCTALLLALGVVMVLSASTIESYDTTGSAFTWFRKQLMWVAVGLPLMWVASRMPAAVFRKLAYPVLAIAVVGLTIVLIPGVGLSLQGATRWISIGGFVFQPSEPAKLALVLWGADLLARKEKLGMLTEWRHLLMPLLPGAGLLVLLVQIGSDLGTTLVLLTIFLALLWVVGAPGRLFVAMLGLIGMLVAIMIMVAPYRIRRLTSFMDPQSDPLNSGYQILHGLYAIASGGWFGLGIGQSREKWQYLPHPESDFIFAVIGEELGLVGTLVVVGLFALLGYAGLRVARRLDDPFMRLAAASATAWLVMQAVVNMGAVMGILPITGIPLPLVSYGGSALMTTLLTLGMLLSFAKQEPGAAAALAARGPGWGGRALSWLGLHGKKNKSKTARKEARR